VTAPDDPGPGSTLDDEEGEDGRDAFDAALLGVVYDIAVASLDQVISLTGGDFLA
jgi:hypothetical protein